MTTATTTTASDDPSDESDDDGDDSESDDDFDADADDHDLLSSVAPEPETDDSGDEAALLALDSAADDGEEKPAPSRRAVNEGAGEQGRGGYTTGGAALHAQARAASSHFQAADALACGPAADLTVCHYDDGEEEGAEEGGGGGGGGGGGDEGKRGEHLPRPGPGEEDVVLVDHAVVSVWRLPARGDGPRSRQPPRAPSPSFSPPRPPPLGSAAFSGGDRDAGPASYGAPRLLARSAYHEIEPYSVARSADGKTVAIGGDLGLVAFLELELCPRGRGRRCALCSAADAAREAARRQQRALELLRRRQAARQREWAAAATASALRGVPPPPPPRALTAADIEAELAAEEEVGVGEEEEEAGEGEEVGGGGGERRRATRRRRSPSSPSSHQSDALNLPAHLRPSAVVTLGSLTAVANNNMINGVRFGLVGGKERLVAAVQDRYVYFVDPPPRRGRGVPRGGGRGAARFAAPPATPPPGSGAVAEALRVVDLTDPNEVDCFEAAEGGGAASEGAGRGAGLAAAAATAAMATPSSSSRPSTPSATSSAPQRVAPPRTRRLDVYVPASREALEVVPDGRTRTAVAGPFPRAANLALPSPDGRLVAVVGDFDGAWVLRARQPAPSARGGAGKEAGAAAAAAAPAAAGAAPTLPGSAPTPPLTRVRRSASAARLASGLRPHPYDATTALRLPFGVASPPRVVCHRGGGGGAAPGGEQTLSTPRGVHDVVVDVGSQYCAWSPDSSLLAATSDALRAAFVWHVPRGQPLFRVEACGRAALAAAFAPSGFPATFAFAEAARRAFVADLRCGAAGFAKLPPLAGFGAGGGGGRGEGEEEERGANGNHRHAHHARQRSHHHHHSSSASSSHPRPPSPPPSPPSFPRPLSRVCGFGITPSGRVLAATRAGLVEWRLAEGWSPRCHADAPPALRRAARALLCAGAARRGSRSRDGAGPWSLPTDVLLSIAEMAAQPRGAWVGVGPGGERRAPPPPSPPSPPSPPPSPQRQQQQQQQRERQQQQREQRGQQQRERQGERQRQPRPVVRLLAPAGGTTYAAVVAMRAPSGGGGGGGLGGNSAAAARAAAAEAALDSRASGAAEEEDPGAWFSR